MNGTKNRGRMGHPMQTASGREFWPLDPRVDEISIEDIAHALAQLCRFGGHCREFYSVAQHSCHVASLVEGWRPPVALHALLHDAAEAYLGDVIQPLNPFVYMARPDGTIERFVAAEARVMAAVGDAFALRVLDSYERATVRFADGQALATEARDLMGAPAWAASLPAADAAKIVPLDPPAAEREFLARFRRLAGAASNEVTP